MRPDFDKRIDEIPWSDFCTAYGPAVNVPDQLRRLADSDSRVAFDASHELWCGLCHQHVQVGSAALPALPFLLEVLDDSDRELTAEILDILLGFAKGTNRKRTEEFQRSLGRIHIEPERSWVAELRTAIGAVLPRFQRLASSKDEELADLAKRTIEELATE